MITFSKSIEKKAKGAAKELLQSGESMKSIPFGRAQNSLFITADKDLIFPLGIVDVDDTTFYFGPKK